MCYWLVKKSVRKSSSRSTNVFLPVAWRLQSYFSFNQRSFYLRCRKLHFTQRSKLDCCQKLPSWDILGDTRRSQAPERSGHLRENSCHETIQIWGKSRLEFLNARNCLRGCKKHNPQLFSASTNCNCWNMWSRHN